MPDWFLWCRARVSAPAIVFFDELDGLAGTRSDGDDANDGVGNRVLAQLLMEMDGLQVQLPHLASHTQYPDDS